MVGPTLSSLRRALLLGPTPLGVADAFTNVARLFLNLNYRG
jgi:hypothetical protein